MVRGSPRHSQSNGGIERANRTVQYKLGAWMTENNTVRWSVGRNESLVGGQGKGQMICNCKGECKSNHCSCFKAKRICGSSCHRNNFNCANHDSHGEDLFLPKNTHELGQDLLLPENSSK